MPFVKNDPNINRKGRPPKSLSWAQLIKEAGETVDINSKKQLKSLVIEQLYLKATRGDISAIKEIIDRTDGKPKTSDVDLSKRPNDEVDISDPRVLKTLIKTAFAVADSARAMSADDEDKSK